MANAPRPVGGPDPPEPEPVILRTLDARAEIFGQATYISVRSESQARRFLANVEQTLRYAAAHPARGSLRRFVDPALAEVRSMAVRGFRNHLVFYVPVEKGIRLLHLLHGARDIDKIIGEEKRQ